MSMGMYQPTDEDSLGNHTDCCSAVWLEADVPFKFCVVQSSDKFVISKYRSFEYESALSIAHSEVFWGTI